MNKPAFDPNQPFTAADKPAFDPSKPFEEASSPGGNVSNKANVEISSNIPKNIKDMNFSDILDYQNKKQPGLFDPEATARGFADTATFGQSNIINAGLGGAVRGAKYLAGKTAGDTGVLDAIKTGYKSDLEAGNVADKTAFKDHPVSYTAGGVVSGIPQLLAGGAALTLPNMVAQGAVQGLGHSPMNSPLSVAGDTAGGALTGGLAGKASEALSVLAQKAGNAVSGIKTNLALRSLGAQKTQLKGVNPEFKSDVAQYALDNNVLSANPFEALSTQQNHVKNLQQSVGNSLNATRDTMPSFDANELLNAITSKNNFNPTLGVNKELTKQLDTVRGDISNLALPGTDKVPAKDVLDLKSQLFSLARKSNGEQNPAKDVLENSRQGIGQVEQKMADSGAYNQDLKNYAILKKIEQLQNNKTSQKGNSALGMGGLMGGMGAMGAVASGHPGLALTGLLGLPAVRSAAGETAAVGLDRIQKLATKLKLDPKVVAYLLSRQDAGESK